MTNKKNYTVTCVPKDSNYGAGRPTQKYTIEAASIKVALNKTYTTYPGAIVVGIIRRL